MNKKDFQKPNYFKMSRNAYPSDMPIRIVSIDNQEFKLQHPELQAREITFQEGMDIADKLETDLICITKTDDCHICKIIDLNKYTYQMKKKKKAEGKSVSHSEMKEIRLTPVIANNDLKIKLTKACKFLEKGNSVKFTMFFKGRQFYSMKETGEKIMLEIIQKLADNGKVRKMPEMEGRKMQFTIFPKR